MQIAADLLVERQERYEPDPPVGRLPDGGLEKWQEKEAERLAAARAGEPPGREWPYEGVYRIAPDGRVPPGYRVGGTAIVCEALIEAPGFAASEARRGAVRRGIEFMLEELAENPRLAPGPKRGYDVRGWAHAYALKLFLRARELDVLDADAAPRVEALVPHLIECLATNALPGGGWSYGGGPSSPFMTGSTLLALYEAHDQGFAVDPGMVERALESLERGRAENGAYAYSGRARGTVAMPGSAARAALCELVLHRAGRSSPDRLRASVRGFLEGWEDLHQRKSRQGTHEGPYGIAPYYFFYGHTYAALAIEALPEAERPALRAAMQELLWRTREEDGSWNDRIFPRTASYSTAMGVLALVAPSLPEVAPWEPPRGLKKEGK